VRGYFDGCELSALKNPSWHLNNKFFRPWDIGIVMQICSRMPTGGLTGNYHILGVHVRRCCHRQCSVCFCHRRRRETTISLERARMCDPFRVFVPFVWTFIRKGKRWPGHKIRVAHTLFIWTVYWIGIQSNDRNNIHAHAVAKFSLSEINKTQSCLIGRKWQNLWFIIYIRIYLGQEVSYLVEPSSRYILTAKLRCPFPIIKYKLKDKGQSHVLGKDWDPCTICTGICVGLYGPYLVYFSEKHWLFTTLISSFPMKNTGYLQH